MKSNLISKVAVFVGTSLLASSLWAGNLQVSGSSTILPIMEAAKGAYKKHSGDSLKLKGGGSSGGVKLLLKGKVDVAMASRGLKSRESSKGAIAHTIGRDGIGVAVHNSVDVSDLKVEDLKAIFSGKKTNWKDFGGQDLSIQLSGPNRKHGTHGAFLSAVGLKKKLSKSCKQKVEHTDTFAAVASTPGAIGWVPLGDLANNSKYKVKALKINGIDPLVSNVKSGSYPIVRPLNLVTKGAATGAAKKLIDWVLSPAGQAFVTQKGFVAAK